MISIFGAGLCSLMILSSITWYIA